MADRLTLGPTRPWGSVVAIPESPGYSGNLFSDSSGLCFVIVLGGR